MLGQSHSSPTAVLMRGDNYAPTLNRVPCDSGTSIKEKEINHQMSLSGCERRMQVIGLTQLDLLREISFDKISRFNHFTSVNISVIINTLQHKGETRWQQT